MKKKLSYNDALSQLEKIVLQLEDDAVQLDSLAAKVNEANELIEYCETRLRTIEEDVAPDRKP